MSYGWSRRRRLVLFTLLASLAVTAARGDEKTSSAEDPKFVRLRSSAAGEPIALETAVVRYTPRDGERPGVTVDLIGAVHIGDKAYYDQINQLFEKYDVVLYELVARRDEVPRAGQRSAHPVSALQVGLKNMLELEFQLDRVDYTKKNLRHADMTPREFAASMRDRGESFSQLFFRMLGQSIAQQSKQPSNSSDVRLLAALFSRDRALELKRVMAEQFDDLSMATAVLDGPEGSTILTERNKRALSVLKQTLSEGHRRIGIFYGAAHLPDMEKRLGADFGLVPTGKRWLTAWSLAAPPPAAAEVEADAEAEAEADAEATAESASPSP